MRTGEPVRGGRARGARKGPLHGEEGSAKGSPLIDTLNDLRARELAVIMQYMRHHYQITGPDGVALADEFKEIASSR